MCSGVRAALRRLCGGVGALCKAKSGGGGGGVGTVGSGVQLREGGMRAV